MWKFVVAAFLCTAVFARANFFDGGIKYNQDIFLEDAPDPLAPDEFVYQILKKGKPECLGVFVGKTAKYAILATAAHCVANYPISSLKVGQGPKPIQNGINVDQVIIHPYYSPPSIDYDIALVKAVGPPVQMPLNISTTEPVSPVLAITWTLNQTDSIFATKNVTLESRMSCKGKLAGHVSITKKMLCVNLEGSLEKGSLVLFNDQLAGVASFAVRNAQTNLPQVYTNIANSEISSFIERYL